MEITYDPIADAAYIRLRAVPARVVRTQEVNDDINIDFGDDGSIVGIEVLSAKERLHLDELSGVAVLNEAPVRIEAEPACA